MLLKYLLVGVIFYFIIKTSRNLMRAVRGELDFSQRDPRFDDPSPRSQGWQDDTSRRGAQSTRSARWKEDVEDAQWEDL